MRKQYQKGNLRREGPSWVAQWRDHGRKVRKTLGRVSEMNKSQALNKLAEIMQQVNNPPPELTDEVTLEQFVKGVYIPFFSRKWKASTFGTTEDRIRYHLLRELGDRPLNSFTRDDLQNHLDTKVKSDLSFSIVDHLKWDLKQIFRMAVAEGYLPKNPTLLLFTPKESRKAVRRRMSREEVKQLFSVLGLRGRLVCMLALIAGMRPGEIFGLCWKHIAEDHVEVVQRVYRGKIDSPKTTHSRRQVALSGKLHEVIEEWRAVSAPKSPETWVFPSEKPATPMSKDNCWRRFIALQLKEVGLDWVNFLVLRRTHSSLMKELRVDPKVVADQLGHTLDVNLNVYTATALETRREAVNSLESVVWIN